MKVLSTLLFVLIFSPLFSQETGSFSMSVDFDESDYMFTRELYFFVPDDYDASASYPLVVGFRGGPHSNAGQFRDQLTFLSDSIGAIIMCPENESHFWNEEGDIKRLFNYSVQLAAETYNIDQDFIYLTGLSYGGRHAVIVAMDTDDGEIPSIRGVIPFAAGSEANLQPNYGSIDEFAPACICIGLSDSQNFINVSNSLHDDITSNGGNSLLNEISGVGHTVSFTTYPEEMMECITFIEQSYEISSIESLTPVLDLQLYPNPAKDQINFTIVSKEPISSIQLVDLNGKLVKTIDNATSGTIDISELSSGIYLLQLDVNGSMVQEKIEVK